MFSSVSQWRRSTLSIILNDTEGYARKKSLAQLNFFEIADGSLQESKYLLSFAKQENFINQASYEQGFKLAEEMGKMLWTEVTALEKSIK
jgi:four helix bundle protein